MNKTVLMKAVISFVVSFLFIMFIQAEGASAAMCILAGVIVGLIIGFL